MPELARIRGPEGLLRANAEWRPFGAECFDADVTVMRDGQTVNGNSIMGLMMLGAGPGSTILVQATGRQAREALDAITELVNSGFDEDSEGTAV